MLEEKLSYHAVSNVLTSTKILLRCVILKREEDKEQKGVFFWLQYFLIFFKFLA